MTVAVDFYFFFQAEDGIRDKLVTGVQTCALPIFAVRDRDAVRVDPGAGPPDGCHDPAPVRVRAEPGGLDQAGRGDGDGDAHGLVRRPGSCDPQLHELGGPFAVPWHLFGQVEPDAVERG